MTRNEFEKAAREQNTRRAAEVAEARVKGGVCSLVPMLAFGPGVSFCSTHRTVVGAMGWPTCPFAEVRS